MLELASILAGLVGFSFVFHGIFLFFSIRKEVIFFYGLTFSKFYIKLFGVFFVTILLLFIILLWVNITQSLISVEQKLFNLFTLIKGINVLNSAILEEVIFRVLVFSSLLYFSKNKIATLIITSILFSFAHFPQNTLEVTSYFLGGIMYGYAFLKFQTVWVPIAIHFFWNFIQGPVLGFPVSGMEHVGFFQIEIVPEMFFNGGDQGPEGSVLGIMMRCIIILMIIFLKPGPPNPKFLEFKESILKMK